MRTKSKQSHKLLKLTYLVVCVFTVNYLFSMNNVSTFIFSDEFNSAVISDDTIPPIEEEMPDTSGFVEETVIDGVDTVWYLGIEEVENDSEDMKIGLLDSFITLNLGNQKKVVQKNLFGFATAGIYSKNQMPINVLPADTFSLDQWQWTSDLQPQVLRFPGGAESKFMDVLNGPGYGWDIATIARYYDMTDSVQDSPTYAEI